jgi:hypothetical protein
MYRMMQIPLMSTRELLARMDSIISDNEFSEIAKELERRGKQPGWGMPRKGDGSTIRVIASAAEKLSRKPT